LGTQVQKVSVTFCPDAAADELPATVVPAPADVLFGVPDAGEAELPDEEQPAAPVDVLADVLDAGGVELPDEEQAAADSTARAALASARPAVPVTRLRRRWGIDFMVPPR